VIEAEDFCPMFYGICNTIQNITAISKEHANMKSTSINIDKEQLHNGLFICLNTKLPHWRENK